MIGPGTNDPESAVAGLAARYPEKTSYLGRVFNDTTNSYKLIWFLAILSLLRRNESTSFSLPELFAEMGTIAWHPVCLYRLSLGRQDKLQDAVREIRSRSSLPANATPGSVRTFVLESEEAGRSLDFIRNYVPARFLAPWFAEELRGHKDSVRNRLIAELAASSQHTSSACPYWLGDGRIHLNESWRAFLLENIAMVEAFAEYHFAHYLQVRNPNVPGIVNKLRAPVARQLGDARRFWRLVRHGFEQSGKADLFGDIYAGRPLGDDFAIDHFLPWSFALHDLLWNLTPVESGTNSSKSDSLPDIELYLPRLARLHFEVVETMQSHPRLLEDHTDCFKLEPSDLLALGEDGLTAKYREVVIPQAQIAMNQGFPSGWAFRE